MARVNDTIHWGEPTMVTEGRATVDCVLECESDALVAECRVSVDGDHPVAVEVRDVIPEALDVERASVRDDSALDSCEATPSEVAFEAVVVPSEPLELTYELQLETEPSKPYGPPEIVRALPMDERREGEESPLLRGGATRVDGGEAGSHARAGPSTAPASPPRPDDEATGELPPSATVEALVEAFRSDDLSEEQLGVLRDRIVTRTSSSADVRLRHVESRLAQFEAYTDSLEAFIEENGTAREVFSELHSDLDRQGAELATLRETHQEAAADRAAIEDEMDTVRADVATVTEEVQALREETDELRSEVEELRDVMESLSTVFAGDGEPSDLPGQ